MYEKFRNFTLFCLYIYKILIFVVETSSWGHFKGNFTLNKKFKICNTLKWVLDPVSTHSKSEKSRNLKICIKAYISVLKRILFLKIIDYDKIHISN